MPALSLGYYSARLPKLLAVFFLLSAVSYIAFSPDASMAFWLLAYSAVVALALVPMLEGYSQSRRAADLEENLPAALFRMSSLSPGAPFEALIGSAAGEGLGEAGRAFSRVSAMLKAGYPARQSLLETAGGYDSESFRRTASLLASLHDSGGELAPAVHAIAEDSFELQQLSREAAAVLSMQKYTLLAAAGFIVPFVFATLLEASRSLAEASTDPPAAAAILASFALAGQVYLLIFSCISCCFIALSEGNLKKAVAYCCVVAPLSLLVFRAAGGAWVLA